MQHYLPHPGSQIRGGKENLFEVTGQGSVEAAPDTAIIQLGIVTEARDVQSAQDENKRRLEKAVNALYKTGISREDIQTASYTISPKYSFQDGKQTLEGYEVVNLLSVKTNQLSRIGEIVDTAVQNGVNRVDRVQFKLDHPQPYAAAALKAAVRQGYEKASVLAESYRVQLQTTPVKAVEVSHGFVPLEREGAALMAAPAASPVPVFPGTLMVTAEVRVFYRFG
ncbi:SIMPL domain-containing protein [Metabacillus mangrovi]|nr:SIMPL domain-containing protein [Metabacillus mangrovi]